MFKNALVSVSDKTGLIEFLGPLYKKGLRIVSTGGTAKFLKENGMRIVEISEQTGYPEVMDGRVRTLHPRVHMALLARSFVPEDFELLKKEGLAPFDLVVGNLYPFEEALRKGNKGQDLVEYIDIGGPSFLRSAAKSFERIAVVCDPGDYSWIAEKGELTLEDRQTLAAKVFSHTSVYDSMIANQLGLKKDAVQRSLGGYRVGELRYGENSHQQASWYRQAGSMWGLHQAEIVQGKAISYNNLLDLDSACHALRLIQNKGVVGVKHNNPCGVARAPSVHEAVKRVLEADPVSIFGGIVASSYEIDEPAAEKLSAVFLECVVAPFFTKGALELLAKKKNLRVLVWKDMLKAQPDFEYRTLAGGFLFQESDLIENWNPQWEVVGEQPSPEQKEELLFAWGTCAALKSNAIAITSDQQTVGLGMGQVNRVDAVEQAIGRWKRFHGGITEVTMASDAFFPFADSIEKAAEAGIHWVIQPGGSVRDEEVRAAAQKLGVNMVLTGRRHFRH